MTMTSCYLSEADREKFAMMFALGVGTKRCFAPTHQQRCVLPARHSGECVGGCDASDKLPCLSRVARAGATIDSWNILQPYCY